MSKKSIILTSLAVLFVVYLSIFLVVKNNSKDKPPINTPEITTNVRFMVDENVYHTVNTAGKEKITIPANPSKNGYAFGGWYQDTELETPFLENSLEETSLTEDMLVYSKWIALFVVNNGTITELTEYAKQNMTEILIPDTIDNVSITGFSATVFARNANLTKVNIGNNILSIENSSFNNCPNLQEAIIGSNVATIGNNAFYNCSKLENVTIGENVVSIGNNAFNNCTSLLNITIPNSVTTIGNAAFINCSSAKALVLGSKVKTLGNNVFQNCSNLESIVVNSENENFTSRDESGAECNVLVDITAGKVILGCQNSVIPTNETITTIASFAFNDCSKLTQITIGNNITTIEMNAFANCNNLSSIVISGNVLDIGYSAFDGCTNLTEVTINSSAIYESAIDASESICGNLLGNAKTVKVLATIVDNALYINDYLNDENNFTASLVEEYYVYTLVEEVVEEEVLENVA